MNLFAILWFPFPYNGSAWTRQVRGCLFLAPCWLRGSWRQQDSLQEGGRQKPSFCSFSFQKVLVKKQDLQIFAKKEVNFCKASCNIESGARTAGKVSANPAQHSAGCSRDAEVTVCRLTALICFGRGMCSTKGIWTSNKPEFTEVSATLQMSSAKTRETRNTFIEVYKLWKNTKWQFLFNCTL